jgi:hypothetical protein
LRDQQGASITNSIQFSFYKLVINYLHFFLIVKVTGAGGLPPQIADMVEKTWLFKV